MESGYSFISCFSVFAGTDLICRLHPPGHPPKPPGLRPRLPAVLPAPQGLQGQAGVSPQAQGLSGVRSTQELPHAPHKEAVSDQGRRLGTPEATFLHF